MDGRCSDFEDHMVIGDEASHCDDVDGGKREVLKKGFR